MFIFVLNPNTHRSINLVMCITFWLARICEMNYYVLKVTFLPRILAGGISPRNIVDTSGALFLVSSENLVPGSECALMNYNMCCSGLISENSSVDK